MIYSFVTIRSIEAFSANRCQLLKQTEGVAWGIGLVCFSLAEYTVVCDRNVKVEFLLWSYWYKNGQPSNVLWVNGGLMLQVT